MTQKCDMCHQTVKGQSVDMMISLTHYDDKGEITSTMDGPVDNIDKGTDYLVFCTSCYVDAVHFWNGMLYRLISGKGA